MHDIHNIRKNKKAWHWFQESSHGLRVWQLQNLCQWAPNTSWVRLWVQIRCVCKLPIKKMQNLCGINSEWFKERSGICRWQEAHGKVSSKTNKIRYLVYIQCKGHLEFSSHMLLVHVFLVIRDCRCLCNFKIYWNGFNQWLMSLILSFLVLLVLCFQLSLIVSLVFSFLMWES